MGTSKKHIEAGADPNISYSYFYGLDKSLLHEAAKEDNAEAVEFLIKHGSRINYDAGDYNGRYPSGVATTYGALKALKVFLKYAPNDINSTDMHGDTKLMIATKHNQIEAMKFLLANKANPNLYNQMKGGTASRYALENGNVEALELLTQNDAEVDCSFIYLLKSMKDNTKLKNYPTAYNAINTAIKKYEYRREEEAREHQRFLAHFHDPRNINPNYERSYPSWAEERSHLSSPALAGDY